MAKYTQKLVDTIVTYIEQDLYTVNEICRMTGINRKTFYEWKNTRPQFRQAIQEASEYRDQILLTTARISLRQKLEGYTLTEETITYQPNKANPAIQTEKCRVVKKKQYPPDLRAIKYILEREDKKQQKETNPAMRPLEIHVPDQHTADNLIKLYEPKHQTSQKEEKEEHTQLTDPHEPMTEKESEKQPPEKPKLTRREQARRAAKDRKTVRYENGQEITYDPVTKITVIKGSSHKFLPPGYLR